MISTWIKPRILNSFLQRNFAEMGSAQPREAWKSFLQKTTSTNENSEHDLEMIRLAQLGYGQGTLVDRWTTFLTAMGYEGDLGDKLRAYFTDTSVATSITFLQATGSSSDSATYTFSAQNLGAASAGRYIVVTVGGRKVGATTTITEVTVGGVTATIVKQQSNTATNTCVSGIVIAKVPAGATGDIVVTFGAAMARAGIGVYRVINLLSPTAHDSDSSTAADPSVSLDVPRGFAIGTAITGTGSLSAWVGLTLSHNTSLEATSTFTSASTTLNVAEAGRTLTCDMNSSLEPAASFASWSLGIV